MIRPSTLYTALLLCFSIAQAMEGDAPATHDHQIIETPALAAKMSALFYEPVETTFSYYQKQQSSAGRITDARPSKLNDKLASSFQCMDNRFFAASSIGIAIPELASAEKFKESLQDKMKTFSPERRNELDREVNKIIDEKTKELAKALSTTCFDAVARWHSGTVSEAGTTAQKEVEEYLVNFFDETIFKPLVANKPDEDRVVETEEFSFKKQLVNLFTEHPDQISKLHSKTEPLYKRHRAAQKFTDVCCASLRKQQVELASRYRSFTTLAQKTAQLPLDQSQQEKAQAADTIWNQYIAPVRGATLIDACKSDSDYYYAAFNTIRTFDNEKLKAFKKALKKVTSSADMPSTSGRKQTALSKSKSSTKSAPELVRTPISPRQRALTQRIAHAFSGNKDKKASQG